MEENKNVSNVKKMRVAEYYYCATPGYHPVFSEDNEELYSVSDDRRDLCVDVRRAIFGAPRRPLRKGPRKPEIIYERNEYIRSYIERNVPDFYDKVEALIFQSVGCHEDELFAFDAEFLRSIFPNLKTVCCHDTVTIENAAPLLHVLDPFEVGEYSFALARAESFDEANRYFRMLQALDSEWTKFWREVAKDFKRLPEDHPKYDPSGPMVHDGMDDLFRVYLLGFYPKSVPIDDDYKKVCVKNHKDLKKAIELLPVRFQNCDLHEIGEKLFWDLQYVEDEETPDYESFGKVLAKAEQLFPGALDQICKDGWIKEGELQKLREMMRE